MDKFAQIPAIWQFGIFALVLVLASSYPPTANLALGIAAAVLLSQLLVMTQKGHNI